MAHAFHVQAGGIVVYDVTQSSNVQQGQKTMDGIDALEVPRGRLLTLLGKILVFLNPR
jgi:hypothetical protein